MNSYDPNALNRRNPEFIERILPSLERFNSLYLRSVSDGIEHVPDGPVLFVANHNGGIMGPDLFCTLALLWRRLTAKSPLFALAHDFAMKQVTPIGRVIQKIGAISATRGNAERVLRSNGQVLVYPGGDLDAYRRFGRRNEVILLPRTGFIDVAKSLRVPIVPIVAEGAHRSAYIFTEGERLARALRLRKWARVSRFPLALALPWGVAPGPWLPYLPLPFRVRLRVLPPVHVAVHEDSAVAAAKLQKSMQTALTEMST